LALSSLSGEFLSVDEVKPALTLAGGAMRGTDFELLVSRIASLSQRQRDKLLDMLQQSTRQEQVIARIEAATAAHLCCPLCRSDRYHKHGRADGLQRYRCIACGKTFNALSGTPLARLRHRAKWLDFTQRMLDSRSVRRAAADLGIHKNTSFRWRHRFLTLTRTDRPQCLHGIAEADEMYMLESEKGSRHLQRPPRKRGGVASKRGISGEQVCILVARDRTGQTLNFVPGKGPVTADQLLDCLLPVIDRDVLLVTDGHAAYRAFARAADITHQAINLRAGVLVKGAVHVQNVNAYHARLRQWLAPFHGVASRYLPNYLGWRWVLDARRIVSAEAMLNAAVGVFPHLMRT
jgi:transposase-like protein